MTLHIPTPLIESRPLSLAAGRNIWLKLDALQPCGSFKLRGVGHACEVHYARGARHLVSSSGGNAGLAVAYAGRKLGVPVTVVVPETTTERAKELLRLENAKVLVHGSSWQEANELALTLVGAGDAFIHPFDDPLLWAGHASLVDEVVATGFKPDAVVLSVGVAGCSAAWSRGCNAMAGRTCRCWPWRRPALPRCTRPCKPGTPWRCRALPRSPARWVPSGWPNRRWPVRVGNRYTATWSATVPRCRLANAFCKTIGYWWSPPVAPRWRWPTTPAPWRVTRTCWWWYAGVLPPLWNRYRRGCDRSTDTGCHMSVSFAVYH